MNIKPLSDHVLLEPLKEEQKTKTGILLPETVEQEKSEQGTVIAVGPGKKGKDGKIIPLEIKAGDIVLFTKYGPNEVKVDGKDYLIAEEKDILAILEK
jgi:chaperonin GroES